jgi:hypothetical protein
MTDRSSRREVRNPILGLPAARQIMSDASPEAQLARLWLWRLLRELNEQCRGNEVVAYGKRKGPMTNYWMSAATYVKHISHILSPRRRRGNIDRIEG